jgi:hypothetical protein
MNLGKIGSGVNTPKWKIIVILAVAFVLLYLTNINLIN